MTPGKDPQTRDGLGGVHNATAPRAPVPAYPPGAAPAPAAVGPIPGRDAAMVEDRDQVGKVVHTAPDPAAAPSDARIAPEQPSAWAAEKPRD
ncbi:hypothetical protein [Caulobacter sp.]|uniref:hypothetical protein n=1 Tax=Caulobacter sp. TaxID=78 RepID=UPI001B19BFE9|nr:hypothetical protein [Caulobacter sp.]MBO9547287.1 hypothetical protein [Caulobacter sp.]